MDDKRDLNKTKRLKNDHVKQAFASYLQKRRYPSLHTSAVTPDDFIAMSAIDCELSRPNSILYSCYNSDPVAVEQSFSKFITCLRDLIKNKKTCHDLELLLPPVFCHIYLDILKGGHTERAICFYKTHLQTVEKMKCDDFIKTLIRSLTDESSTALRELLRSNKYLLHLSPTSISTLKKFVAENSHVVFLQALQNWFDIRELEEDVTSSEDCTEMSPEREAVSFDEVKSVVDDLENETRPVYCVNIGNVKERINCAVIKRTAGIIAYSQQSSVCVRPVHSFDDVALHKNYKELSFNGHEGKLYDIAVSSNSEYIVTASCDSNVCIFDLTNAALQKVCKGHLGPVYCVTISNPPLFIASGSHDTTARLWSIDKGETHRIFMGHSQPITCIEFHPNNLYVATGSSDRTVRLWCTENGKMTRLFQAAKGPIFAIAFHPLGQHIAGSSDDRRIYVWDVLQCKVIVELKCNDDFVTKLAWSIDGRFLSGGTISGVFIVWDFENVLDGNLGEVKFLEPYMTVNLNSRILHVEYSCGSFACATSA